MYAKRLGLPAVALAATLILSACGTSGGGGGAEEAADTLTRRQKDSLVSEMPIPGSGAVRRALDASDKARERAEMLDTIR